MTLSSHPRFLPALLWADAASAATCAALQMAAAGWLSEVVGLSAGLLFATGAVLWPFAFAAAWLARRDPPPRNGVRALAVANGVWVLGCVGLLLAGAASTALGQAYLLVQAVAVGLLAELQWLAARGGRRQVSAAG